jgi:hypothetical protein
LVAKVHEKFELYQHFDKKATERGKGRWQQATSNRQQAGKP